MKITELLPLKAYEYTLSISVRVVLGNMVILGNPKCKITSG